MADREGMLHPQKDEMTVTEETERTRDQQVYIPRADIYETEDAMIVLADVPGVDEKSVDITIEKNVLTINAFVEVEQPENYRCTYAEYGVGDFERRFILSNQVNRDEIEASVKDGVLRLRLPKSKEAKTRKISVTAG
ncbi:MAG TPA: Hsp20/alpha crystallin family protein [Levilinea sp.]|nr:Hsp20/alpha crystallin family protein [Levilinea sp.]